MNGMDGNIFVLYRVMERKNCRECMKKYYEYVFTVYALDCQLGISEKSNRNELLDAMRGHILSETKLFGKYKRVH